MSIAEILAHPFVLLLFTAGISGLLIPYFTNRWQLHQKGIEIRIDLVRLISKNIMEIMTKIDSAKTTKSIEDLGNEYGSLKVDHAVIKSELESYFSYLEIRDEWEDLLEEIEKYYVESKYVVTNLGGDRGKTCIDDKREEILVSKHRIIELVLNKPIPRFSLLPRFIVRSRFYKWLAKKGYLDAGPKETRRRRKKEVVKKTRESSTE